MASTRAGQGTGAAGRAGSGTASSSGSSGGSSATSRGARGAQGGQRGAADAVGIAGSAAATGAPDDARTTGAATGGPSTGDAERQVPLGRESAQPPRSGARGSMRASSSSGGAGYPSPFSFMRRFGEEMDRLFEDFGFAPPGVESQLSLLGLPGGGGRVSMNATPGRRADAGSAAGSTETRGGAVGRPASSGALAQRTTWMPEMEVVQRGDRLVVRADLPGLRREDVHVHLDDGLLTLSGERRYEAEGEDEGVYHSERSYGYFSRSIPLPQGLDPEACEARFTDGVLEVSLRLPQAESRSRRIEVR